MLRSKKIKLTNGEAAIAKLFTRFPFKLISADSFTDESIKDTPDKLSEVFYVFMHYNSTLSSLARF